MNQKVANVELTRQPRFLESSLEAGNRPPESSVQGTLFGEGRNLRITVYRRRAYSIGGTCSTKPGAAHWAMDPSLRPVVDATRLHVTRRQNHSNATGTHRFRRLCNRDCDGPSSFKPCAADLPQGTCNRGIGAKQALMSDGSCCRLQSVTESGG